jgi:TonB family protein
MAFRVLLFSKGPEANAALTAACQSAGIRLEICEDIFSAIDKGTKQPFSGVIVDWADQPESGFLLKRARESAVNLTAIAIAIVDREPTAAEMRDHRLNFLIYRPVAALEAGEVLAKASEKMPPVAIDSIPEKRKSAPPPDSAAVESLPAPPRKEPADRQLRNEAAFADEPGSPESAADPEFESEAEEEFVPSGHRFPLQAVVAAALALAASYCLWNARDTLSYLARTRDNRSSIFKESVSALFYLNPPVAPSSGTIPADLPVEAYVSRSAGHSDPHLQLGVVSAEADVSGSPIQLRPPSDFPLPAPVYQPAPPPPVAVRRGVVPDSLRGSAPIAPPVVVTTPAQLMPVSSPMVPPISTQQFSEPVSVSEEAARALLLHSVVPAYPPEAQAQKLHGPVVLQAIIGRDGTVEDLKIVRGSFVLSKAAITAVKQWRFQPYTVNGHAAQIQTLLTIAFNSPQG